MHGREHPDEQRRSLERQLIARIKAQEPGWEHLFGELVEPHIEAMRARCQRYLRHPEDAADATQEALLRAYRAIHRFRGEAALRTWLFTIADNACYNLARQRARYVVQPNIESLLTERSGLDVDMRPNQADERHLVHAAIARIRATDRDILQLRYFADLSIAEVARTLDLGLSATKMRLYRAQAQVAALLGRDSVHQAA